MTDPRYPPVNHPPTSRFFPARTRSPSITSDKSALTDLPEQYQAFRPQLIENGANGDGEGSDRSVDENGGAAQAAARGDFEPEAFGRALVTEERREFALQGAMAEQGALPPVQIIDEMATGQHDPEEEAADEQEEAWDPVSGPWPMDVDSPNGDIVIRPQSGQEDMASSIQQSATSSDQPKTYTPAQSTPLSTSDDILSSVITTTLPSTTYPGPNDQPADLSTRTPTQHTQMRDGQPNQDEHSDCSSIAIITDPEEMAHIVGIGNRSRGHRRVVSSCSEVEPLRRMVPVGAADSSGKSECGDYSTDMPVGRRKMAVMLPFVRPRIAGSRRPVKRDIYGKLEDFEEIITGIRDRHLELLTRRANRKANYRRRIMSRDSDDLDDCNNNAGSNSEAQQDGDSGSDVDPHLHGLTVPLPPGLSRPHADVIPTIRKKSLADAYEERGWRAKGRRFVKKQKTRKPNDGRMFLDTEALVARGQYESDEDAEGSDEGDEDEDGDDESGDGDDEDGDSGNHGHGQQKANSKGKQPVRPLPRKSVPVSGSKQPRSQIRPTTSLDLRDNGMSQIYSLGSSPPVAASKQEERYLRSYLNLFKSAQRVNIASARKKAVATLATTQTTGSATNASVLRSPGNGDFGFNPDDGDAAPNLPEDQPMQMVERAQTELPATVSAAPSTRHPVRGALSRPTATIRRSGAHIGAVPLDGAAASATKIPLAFVFGPNKGLDGLLAARIDEESPMQQGHRRVFDAAPPDSFAFCRIDSRNKKDIEQRLASPFSIHNPVTNVHQTFKFLCSTDSQLKSEGVIYFQESATEKVDTFLEQFGELRDVYRRSGPGKYIARCGLVFSVTRPTVEIGKGECAAVPDVAARDGKLYTDGCGLITLATAGRIKDALGLSYTPYVFQIRFRGAKGTVIACSQTELQAIIPAELYTEACQIYLRDSMVKFEASDKFSLIEILDYSPAEVSMPAKLSRQPGSILSSLGLPDHVLLDLVKENHDALLGGLSDREAVEKWLRTIGGDVTAPQRVSTNGQKHQKQKSALRFGNKADRKDNYLASQALLMAQAGQKLDDPWFMALKRRLISQQIAEDDRIPVPQSVRLFGVVDVSNTLKENEVYLQVEGLGFITGDMIMFRDPCTHPGDIRKVRGVQPKHYTNIKNCVVLPMQGDQPLSDQIAGGDLDGDTYFLSWNPALMPPTFVQPNPRHPPTSIELAEPVEHEYSTNGLIQHIIDRLTHHGLADAAGGWDKVVAASAQGALDENAIKWSAKYEYELDVNKNGGDAPVKVSGKPAGPQREGKFVYTALAEHREVLHKQLWQPNGRYGKIPPESRAAFEIDSDLVFFIDEKGYRDSWEEAKNINAALRLALRRIEQNLRSPNEPINSAAMADDPFTKASSASSAKQISNDFEKEVQRAAEQAFYYDDIRDGNLLRQKASAFYACTYHTIRNCPEDKKDTGVIPAIAWFGMRFLNELKATRVNFRNGNFYPSPVRISRPGPQAAIAPSDSFSDFVSSAIALRRKNLVNEEKQRSNWIERLAETAELPSLKSRGKKRKVDDSLWEDDVPDDGSGRFGLTRSLLEDAYAGGAMQAESSKRPRLT